MAFYHTYRPQNFNDIKLTQAKVAETLVLSLIKRQLSHAYLFTGTHGTGKTTTARIVAMAVNCEKLESVPDLKEFAKEKDFDKAVKDFPVPCNMCDACKAIAAGSFLDVIEMDAASNRGIDEIRDLKEKIRLAPMHANKKVYIIDEVHMLTTEAFNALLKTLEEPPAHSLFVLCTTELHKVPQTIQSRCTKVIFQKPGTAEITTLLAHIAQSEKLKIEDAALFALAKAAGGAFRDAVKLLEMASVQFPTITAENIGQMLVGSTRVDSVQIVSLLRTGSTKELLTLVRSFETNGIHFSELLKTLLTDARDLLLFKVGAIQAGDVSCLTGLSTQELQTASAVLDAGFLSEYIDALVKAMGQQKATPIPSLPVELVFMKLSGVAQSAPRASVPVQPAAATAPVSQTISVKKAPATESVPKTTVVEKSEVVEVDDIVIATEEVIAVQEAPERMLPSSTIPTVTNEELTIDLMQERWPEVVKLLKKYHASMAVMISKCKPIRLDGKQVIIETQNSFNKDMIESAKNRPVIEQAIYELLGAQVRVKTQLANTKLTQKNVENVQPVADDDLVSMAQEIFGA